LAVSALFYWDGPAQAAARRAALFRPMARRAGSWQRRRTRMGRGRARRSICTLIIASTVFRRPLTSAGGPGCPKCPPRMWPTTTTVAAAAPTTAHIRLFLTMLPRFWLRRSGFWAGPGGGCRPGLIGRRAM
jgi:hypothetical protein